MRVKHYFLILFILVVIAFFQPLIVFLGNLLVIVAAAAYIYSDMTPEAQDHYERRLMNALARARNSLRRNKAEIQPLEPHRGGRLSRILGRTPRPVTETRHMAERD